jgi:RHS repeat-associated protein
MTSRPGQTLTYDATGKLATVTAGTATQSNIYDSSGTPLMQTETTTGTTLFLDGTDVHIGPGTTGVSAVRTYTADGVPFAERTTTPGVAGSVLRWITTDIDQSSDLQVVVSTGAITRRYIDPYGNPRGATPTWSSNHTFLNAPKSALSGLVQLGARAYDSATGKFLSVDPVLEPLNPQQNNGYAYSSNSPITLTDPSGLRPLGSGNTGASDYRGRNSYDDNRGNDTPPAPGGGDGKPGTPKAGSPTGGGLPVTFSAPNVRKEIEKAKLRVAQSPNLGNLFVLWENQRILDMLETPGGAIAPQWLVGGVSKAEYGEGSQLVQSLKGQKETMEAREKLIDHLESGDGTTYEDGGYNPGSAIGAGTGQFISDGCTYVVWGDGCGSGNTTRSVLGTYKLDINAEIGPDGHSAVLRYEGGNVTSLGSFAGVTDFTRDWGNALTPGSGPMANFEQHWTWSETVSW